MKLFLIILGLSVSQAAMAQLFKCTDAAGKTTYSSTRCSDLGLKDAGEIKDRIQVTPAPPAAQPSRTARPPAPSSDRGETPAAPRASGEAAKEPERRCFTITAAGGKKVTRCNDKPDEPAE